MNWLLILGILAVLYLFVFHGHRGNGTPEIHLKRFVGYQNGSQ